MNDSEKLIQARTYVIDAFGSSFALYGLPDVVGRIYGVLYFETEPMDLEEIADRLEVSKATVSINIRVLEGIKCVKKVWKKGSRRDYYEVQRDFTKVFRELLQTNIKKELEITGEALASSRQILLELKESKDTEIRKAAASDCRFIEDLSGQYKRYGRIIDILGAGEKIWNLITFKKSDKG